MGMELKDENELKNRKLRNKAMGLRRFFNSFKNSFCGLKYAYTHEQSLLIHVSLSIIVIATGIAFEISGTYWVLILFAMSLIIVTELLNTAIEATIDMITEEYNPLAKVAKDCASAAVFMVSMIAACIWCYVFIPKIISLIF